MDWYSWLSKSGLEPSLVYDFSLLFTHNELEEEDIVHFNHEFLLSMGISIAKHRLEILKLAEKLQRKKRPPQPVARILSAVSKTKKCLARYFNTLTVGRDRSAIVVVPKPAATGGGGAGRWKGTMLKRNRRLVRLMITDGGVKVRKPGPDSVSVSHSASPMVGRGGGGGKDGCWGSGEEEIRWDSMFQNLKPT